MTEYDTEILLYRILSGKTYFIYSDEEYCLVSPSKEIKYEALRLYNGIINEEKYYNWIREEHSINIMISLGLWEIKTEDILKSLEKQLDDLKLELYKAFPFPSQQPKIRKNIASVKKSINNIYVTKHEFSTHTLEGYASTIKNEYIICKTLYKNNELVFENAPNNLNSSYTDFNNIVREIDNSIITTEKYKFLARSNIWKSYWNCNKYGNLFSTNISDVTEEQRALINISRMYDNIYEHPECPDDKVIHDDDMLDGWMIFQKRKKEKDKKQEDFLNANNKMKNSSEIFMLASKQEEAKEILDLNTDKAKSIMMSKLNYVRAHGTVEDHDTPATQAAIKEQINELHKRNK